MLALVAFAGAAALRPGPARAAVVINEINYHPDTADQREEYVELHNTGDSSVSLAGWRFVKGITYTFPSTATLPAHGYLAVARDRARLVSLFGSSNVVGNYAGQLDDGGERLTLHNDAGTTIDTVRYDDQWPWPAAADGVGSSLELVNPNDPNDDPRNWRGAVRGTSGSELYQHNALVFSHRHYNNADDTTDRYRLSDVPIPIDAARTLQSIGLPSVPPTGNIYIFGLTLFNGTSYTTINLAPYVNQDGFSFDTNRADGNLGGNNACFPAEELQTSGGSTACQGPGHAGVRWLTPNTANGARNMIQSGAQTIPVPPGQYVRAYFLATLRGTNLVNTYVSLNYSAGGSVNQPFEITQWHMNVALPTHPTSLATPGAPNSVYSPNTPPFIHNIVHAPATPAPGQPVTVTAQIEDSSGIAQAALFYAVNEGTTQTLALYDDGAHGDGAAGDGVFGAAIPGQANQSIVAYWITARDGAGATERFPYAAEPEQALAYFVYDRSIATNLPTVWLFLPTLPNPSTDETVPGSYVDDTGRVYYHVQVRNRGAWARSWPKKCWKIYFNKGNEFNGQGTIDLNSNYNDRLLMRENLCYETFRFGGYPACKTRPVRLQLSNAGPAQFWGVYVEVEQPGPDYIRRNGLDPAGALYKAVDNGFYPPRSNESSQPLTRYYTIYEKKTREWEDYTDLITWTRGLDTATRTATVLNYFNQTTDLWRLGEYLALNTLVSNWDHVGKNHYDFRDTRTNKWLQTPWDMDRTMGEGPGYQYRADQPIDYGRRDVPGPSGMYSFLQDCYFEEPRLLNFHYRMLRRFCYLFFTEERMHATADRTRALIGADGDADLARWRPTESYSTYWSNWRTANDYLANRRNYVLSRLPAQGDVVINEFLTSNTRTVRDPAGHFEDWVELYNPKSTAVNLGGCYLSDNLSSPTKWRFPDNTFIAGNGRLLIWCDGRTTETGGLHTNFRLSDSGEQIGLFDTDANANLPIDWWTFGPQVADVSVGRNGDGAWEWVAYSTPTPGNPNVARSAGTPTVRFNEWLASNQTINVDENGGHADWLELHNYGNEPVCIGGRFLTDSLSEHDTWMIPYCTVIPARGFRVVWCDGETNQGPLHADFRLDAQAGGQLALYDTNTATLIDSITFGPQVADVSQGRYPDGAGGIYTLSWPTPGAPNVLAIAPAAPSSLAAATVSASRINLTWQDNSVNEDGFKLERKTGPGSAWSQVTTATADVSAWPDTGLLPYTLYYYRVRAYNRWGLSAYTAEASARTLDVPPAAPSNLVAAAFSSTRIDLAWRDNSNNEQGFKLERRAGFAGPWTQITTTSASVRNWRDGGVQPGAAYSYRVRAYNAVGHSAYSNEAFRTTPSQTRAVRWELYP